MKESVQQTEADDFEQQELQLLEKLCEQFRSRNNHRVHPNLFEKNFAVKDRDTAYRLFERLKGIGAIEERYDRLAPFTGRADHGKYHVISPLIFEITAARRAEMKASHEPADRVAAIERWARSHPLLSILFIAIVVLTLIVTLLNQLADLIGRIF